MILLCNDADVVSSCFLSKPLGRKYHPDLVEAVSEPWLSKVVQRRFGVAVKAGQSGFSTDL